MTVRFYAQLLKGKTMLGFRSADANAVLEALNKSQAVIEFKLDGTIVTANENFCQAMGYELSEIKGQHHRMFIESAEAGSENYKAFWKSLAEGKFFRAQYKRIGKGGK